MALVYSMGILMVPMFLSWTFHLTSFLLLFLLTFVNLTIFSWYEKIEDEKDGFQSIATQMNAIKLERMMLLLISIGLALSFLLIDITHIYFFIGFSIYGFMILFSGYFGRNKL
ncbi:MAG: hypothetical protein ABJQ96_18795, partial [Crocinitomicaceae bacterium]